MNLIAGSTGFLGNHLLLELNSKSEDIIALSRRTIPNLPEKIEELLIDFDQLSELKFPQIDRIYLSLGYPLYYQNVMGFMSKKLKEDFFQVDFSYQLEIARKAKEAGAKSITLISACGADSNSWNYYLKTKGMLEKEIIKLGFETTNIFQPGHLRGNKLRLDIIVADLVSIVIDPFLHGPFKKFRSISVKKLSSSIINYSLSRVKGVNYFEFEDFH